MTMVKTPGLSFRMMTLNHKLFYNMLADDYSRCQASRVMAPVITPAWNWAAGGYEGFLINLLTPNNQRDFPALSADNDTSYTHPTHNPNYRLLLHIKLRVVNGSYDTMWLHQRMDGIPQRIGFLPWVGVFVLPKGSGVASFFVYWTDSMEEMPLSCLSRKTHSLGLYHPE